MQRLAAPAGLPTTAAAAAARRAAPVCCTTHSALPAARDVLHAPAHTTAACRRACCGRTDTSLLLKAEVCGGTGAGGRERAGQGWDTTNERGPATPALTALLLRRLHGTAAMQVTAAAAMAACFVLRDWDSWLV